MTKLPILEQDAADPEFDCALKLIDKERYPEAVPFLEMADRRDIPSAQYILGQMYASGKGVETDPQRALRYFRKASDNGMPYADADLGVCYYNGFGCEPASAASVAGAKRLVAEGVIGADERVVCILTGHELKDPNATVAYHGSDAAFYEKVLGSRGVATREFANSPVVVANDVDQILSLL